MKLKNHFIINNKSGEFIILKYDNIKNSKKNDKTCIMK